MSVPAHITAAIDGIRRLDGEANLLGHTYILGVLHHVWLVAVVEVDGQQLPVDDPHHRFDDFHYLSGDGGPFETIEVPGFPGSYALVVAPAVR